MPPAQELRHPAPTRFSLPLAESVEPPARTQTDFPAKLLRRSRGSGRRLSLLLRRRWGRGCSRCLLLLLRLLVVVFVLRGALGRLSGLGLRLSCRSRRSRGGLRGLLCDHRQRQCQHDGRPENNSQYLLGFHSILLKFNPEI